MLQIYSENLSSFTRAQRRVEKEKCALDAGGRFEILAEDDGDSEDHLDDALLEGEEVGAVHVPSLPAGYIPPT